MILQIRIYRFFLRLGTYLLPIPAFTLGVVLWTRVCHILNHAVWFMPHDHIGQLLFGAVAWALLSERYRVTNFDELFRERTGVRNAWSACIATSFLLLALMYFTGKQLFPRGLLICDVFALLCLTTALHAVFRVLCRHRVNPAHATRLLIVGADEFAVQCATRLQRLSFAACEVAGYIRLPGQTSRVSSALTYELEQLGVLKSRIDEAVIAIPPSRFGELPPVMEALKQNCLPARAVVDLGERVVVREKLFQIGNIQMLDLTATPTESLDYALLKRAFDVCFSMLVLALAAPLLVLIAVTIKITSPGDVLFTQERVGLNSRPFRMYKFRTMRQAALSESDTLWTRERDPRVTPFGSFLRRTSFDELPQFFNVLRGEMSVVGPRPERPHFVHKFLQEVSSYNIRHSLKVGITGWAQVNGWRGDTSIEKRVEYDLYYLQNWSFSFDMKIIVMTLFSGLIAKNAY